MKTSKTVRLPSGGSVAVTFDDVNILALSRAEWELVFSLVDRVNSAESTFPVTAGPAPTAKVVER